MPKGLTPVVAVILLLLIAVALVGLSFVYFNRAASSSAQSNENQSKNLVQLSGAQVSIESVQQNKVYIRNIGKVPITQPAFYANDVSIPVISTPISLSPGSVGSYDLDPNALNAIPSLTEIKVTVGKSSDKIDVDTGDLILLKSALTKVMKIGSNGDVTIKGTLSQVPPATPPASTPADEIRILASGGGSNAVVINLFNGNVAITGALYENQNPLSTNTMRNELVIKDDNGNVVVIFDDHGDFYLKGTLTTNHVV
jgi:flagellin-like protein